MEQSSGETGSSVEAASSADNVEKKLDPIDAPSNDSNSIVIKHRRSSTTSRQSSILNGGKWNSSSGLYSSTIVSQGKSMKLIPV